MKTKKSKKEETVSIAFPYQVFKCGKLVLSGMLDEDIRVSNIQEVAKIMEDNGGYPLNMDAFQNLVDILYLDLYDNIFYDKKSAFYTDEEVSDEYYVDICDSMPIALIEAAEKYIKHKTVEQNFYLDDDGVEKMFSISLEIPCDSFNKMKEIISSGPYEQTDFEMLKQQDPEVYAEVTNLIYEEAEKMVLNQYGVHKPCVLKFFPSQVYESI